MRFLIMGNNTTGPVGKTSDDLRDALDIAAQMKASRLTPVTIKDSTTGEVYTESQIFVPNFRLRDKS